MSYLIYKDVCLNVIVHITKFINMSLNILFFLCIFLWNSNVSGNESSCLDVYNEMQTLKKLFSDEIQDLKTVVISQDSEIKELKKQMVMYRNNGNDCLDEKVVSKSIQFICGFTRITPLSL